MKKSLTGLVAALGLLCLAPVASASVIHFNFDTEETQDQNHFDITGGSGLYAGGTSNGSSVISITRWFSGLPEFNEVGKMHHHNPKPPTTVPEPGLTSLVGLGLIMIGCVAYRRRRVDVNRD